MNYFVQPSTTDRSPYGVHLPVRYLGALQRLHQDRQRHGAGCGHQAGLRRNHERQQHRILRETNLVSTLVEMAYINNASDRAKLTSPAYQQRFANGIVQRRVRLLRNPKAVRASLPTEGALANIGRCHTGCAREPTRRIADVRAQGHIPRPDDALRQFRLLRQYKKRAGHLPGSLRPISRPCPPAGSIAAGCA